MGKLLKKAGLLITGLILISSDTTFGWVYSVDGLIDVNRMAVDKMYYDLYYNPLTALFSRPDLRTLSPEAIALIEGAIEAKVDRAQLADYADKSKYNTGATGYSFCFGDPYTGSGTATNPEIQEPRKPNCIYGGALFADENIGYVHTIDRAYKALNSKEVTDSFQANKFNNPVPRAWSSPSSNHTWIGEKYTIHNDGNMKWKDGVPVGLDVMNWTGTCPGGVNPQTGLKCFDVVNDGGAIASANEAYWADRAYTASMLGRVNYDMLTVDKTEISLNQNKQAKIGTRHYTFLINDYTATKYGVQFCDVGWTSNKNVTLTTTPGLCGQYCGGFYCGGTYECTEDCIAYAPSNSSCSVDSIGNCTCPDPNDPQKTVSCSSVGVTAICIQSLYRCTIKDACINADDSCHSIDTGAISIHNQPVTINIDMPGNVTCLEPGNITCPDVIYQAAQVQLPERVKYNGIPLKDIVKCDGKPEAYSNCYKNSQNSW